MISQIRKYDPYPCILGMPVMPALFATCKVRWPAWKCVICVVRRSHPGAPTPALAQFYIFVCFLLIGTRIMVACMRELALAESGGGGGGAVGRGE